MDEGIKPKSRWRICRRMKDDYLDEVQDGHGEVEDR
jgi:hypothetical protein